MRLPAIELAAARLLAGRAAESVLTHTTPTDVLENAQRAGQLWVVLADDVPVGFALVELIGWNEVHLEEIDVHPEHGRRGLLWIGRGVPDHQLEGGVVNLADAELESGEQMPACLDPARPSQRDESADLDGRYSIALSSATRVRHT